MESFTSLEKPHLFGRASGCESGSMFAGGHGNGCYAMGETGEIMCGIARPCILMAVCAVLSSKRLERWLHHR